MNGIYFKICLFYFLTNNEAHPQNEHHEISKVLMVIGMSLDCKFYCTSYCFIYVTLKIE